MSERQKSSNHIFIDYKPSELKENKTWRIVYYVKNPFTDKLVRKLVRVMPHKSILERRKLAKKMMLKIDQRLAEGWNPFHQSKGTKEFSRFIDILKVFLKRIEKEFNDGNFRKDSHKTYKSQINLLEQYILEVKNDSEMMCFKFDDEFNLTNEFALDVSDHYPIELQLRDKNLISCSTIIRIPVFTVLFCQLIFKFCG